MTAQKHTLEPWQVRTDLDGEPKLDSRDGYTVERADPTAGKPFVVSTWSLTNALLIAAAPDLLDALIGLLAANDAVQSVLCDGPEVPGFDPTALGRAQLRVTEAEDVARAAIAKAEGRS